MTPTPTPTVECRSCRRRVDCFTAKDGTVYRPFAWTFPFPETLVGLCRQCSLDREYAEKQTIQRPVTTWLRRSE